MLSIKEIVTNTNGKLINGKEEKSISSFKIDSRLIEKGDFFIPINGEKVNGHDFIIDCVNHGVVGFFIEKDFKNKENVINESINLNKNICIIEVENSENALKDLATYNRIKHINIPIVAVTGSVGKTSTRQIVASVLSKEKNILVTEKNYNSNIGMPLMLLKLENQDAAVLEVGIDEVGQMTELSEIIKPDIAIITIIGTAHIGRIGSREKIYEEKIKITDYIQGEKIVILNNDNEYLNGLSSNKYKIKRIALSDVNNINEENRLEFITNIYNNNEKITLNVNGIHNIYNALFAIRVGEIFNIKKENILKGLEEYKNYSRRFEVINIGNDIKIIDDTYNANYDSMKSGLECANSLNAKRKIAVLGDMLDLGKYSEKLHRNVGMLFKNLNFNYLYVIGDNAKYIADEAKKYMNEEKIKVYNDKALLINGIKLEMTKGDLIYFKASNGMKFNEIIKKLTK